MQNSSPRLIYAPNYNVKFLGIENLHPFDSCKYEKAWKLLKERFGNQLNEITISPKKYVSDKELLSVHTQSYLSSLEGMNASRNICEALELPFLSFLPSFFLKKAILEPMRWAVMGTAIAASESLKNGIAINLSGGYHHASRDKGEGFCIYSDLAFAIESIRKNNQIKAQAKIGIIDLDAHQGNGIERIYLNDRSIYFFDMYNSDIYPSDELAKERIDFDIPLESYCDGDTYLGKLKDSLPDFLQKVNQDESASIFFYNAGTDVLGGDTLGKLSLSQDRVLERDSFVAKTLTQHNIPWVMVTSGGYTRESYLLIANSISNILQTYGGCKYVRSK